MQNVYSTPLKYTNFNGVTRMTKLHFHLTPREFVDWMLEDREKADKLMSDFQRVRGDIVDENGNIKEEADANFSSEDIRIMLRMVKVLAELSYGVPSDDGEHFDKSGLQKFIYSAAYDGFRMFLFENPKELEAFFNGVLNEEVVSEFGKRMAEIEADQEDEPSKSALPISDKKPQEMTRSELEAAFRARTEARLQS